jgi:hypothetical protein
MCTVWVEDGYLERKAVVNVLNQVVPYYQKVIFKE